MKLIGRVPRALCILILAAVANASWGAISASLDRDRAALGDTLRLTITASGDDKLDDLDLGPLTADFDILGRSSSSNTSYINGQFSSTRELLLDITPRREGSLSIPPLRAGGQVTVRLPLTVGPAPRGGSAGAGGDQNVVFEAELDRSSVYVQGQVILTLRLQQAINLEDRNINQLQLDNAFVHPLEQHSFQRTIDGRPWLVHEVRYAIFPEQSGTLDIPAQTFSARESTPRRSLFDIGGGGRQLRRTTQALSIEVLPRPDNFPGTEWLPAQNLTIEESWSSAPEQLKVGESSTRTITIRGEGLQGAQLPPVMFPPTKGLKYYPDQPVISDGESATGLVGSRVDSVAVVPTEAGRWQIPELRIPWWDTQARKVRYAVLPGRELDVAAGAATTAVQATAAQPTADIALNPGQGNIPLVSGDNSRLWQLVSAITGLGWLLTLLYVARLRQGRKAPKEQGTGEPGEQPAFRQLQKACASGSAHEARAAVINWAGALTARPQLGSLAQVAAVFGDPAMATALDTLNAALYSGDSPAWDGAALADATRRLRAIHRKAKKTGEDTLQLYPQGT